MPWASDAFLVTGIAAVALLTAVAFGHPNGFDALPIGEADQVADGAVRRDKTPAHLASAHAVALLAQPAAERGGQGRDLVQRCNSLTIKRVKQLPGPVGGLAGFLDQNRKLLKRKPQKIGMCTGSHASN